jgi:hypothetical protein
MNSNPSRVFSKTAFLRFLTINADVRGGENNSQTTCAPTMLTPTHHLSAGDDRVRGRADDPRARHEATRKNPSISVSSCCFVDRLPVLCCLHPGIRADFIWLDRRIKRQGRKEKTPGAQRNLCAPGGLAVRPWRCHVRPVPTLDCNPL